MMPTQNTIAPPSALEMSEPLVTAPPLEALAVEALLLQQMRLSLETQRRALRMWLADIERLLGYEPKRCPKCGHTDR